MTNRQAFKQWYGACRALARREPDRLHVHHHDGLRTVFYSGMLSPECNGIHRSGWRASAHLLAVVTLDECRLYPTSKGFRRCTIATARHYRIHGTDRHCPIPA